MALRNSLQLTLALIKPDATAIPYVVQSIHDIILSEGFIVLERAVTSLTRKRAEAFYEEHRERFFYNRLVTFMSSGPLEALVLLHPQADAVSRWRRLMGPSRVYTCQHTHPHSIRALYGLTDTRNTIHGSDSAANAVREIAFFFPDFDIDKFCELKKENILVGNYQFDEDSFQHIPV